MISAVMCSVGMCCTARGVGCSSAWRTPCSGGGQGLSCSVFCGDLLHCQGCRVLLGLEDSLFRWGNMGCGGVRASNARGSGSGSWCSVFAGVAPTDTGDAQCTHTHVYVHTRPDMHSSCCMWCSFPVLRVAQQHCV
jgi:hypothetical protein